MNSLLARIMSVFLVVCSMFFFSAPSAHALTTKDITVSTLQTFLEQKGFLVIPKGNTKGNFGPATKKALIEYQKSAGLPAEGVFGTKTKATIAAELSGTPTPDAQPLSAQTKSQNQTVSNQSVSREELDTRLQQLNNSFLSKLSTITAKGGTSVPSPSVNYAQMALSNRIDQLTNTTINTPTIKGGSITGASISGLTTANIGGLTYATKPEAIYSTWDIVAWGDSLTQGSYPSQLSTLLGGRPVLSAGIGGQTSTQIAARMIAAPERFGNTTIIWAGENNWTSPTTVVADIQNMVSRLTTTHFVVLSILNGATLGLGDPRYDTIIGINNSLKALYPNNYVDVRANLIAHYDPSQPQDVIDHTSDIIPTSLRTDSIHLTTAGYLLVAQQVSAFIQNMELADASIANGIITRSNLPWAFSAPHQIGSVTPNTAAFTTLSAATTTISGGLNVSSTLSIVPGGTPLANGYYFLQGSVPGAVSRMTFDQANQQITFENHNVDSGRGGGIARPNNTSALTVFSLDRTAGAAETTGYVTLNAGGTSGLGTERVRVNGATGNVGIGTTSPSTALAVVGSITSTALQNNVNGVVYVDNSGKLLTTTTGGAGTLCLTSVNGGVPVFGSCSGSASSVWSGLTAPSANLSLGMAANTSMFTWNDTSANNLFSLKDTAGNTGTGYLFQVSTQNTNRKPFNVQANGVDALVVNASGNVTIGGATALNGNVTFGTDNAYDIGATATSRPRYIYVGSSITSPSYTVTYNGDFTAWGNGNGALSATFKAVTGAGEASIISTNNILHLGNNDGTLLAGKIGLATTTPWRTLSVTGSVGFDGLTVGAGAGALCLSANKEVLYLAGSTACLTSSKRFKHDIATSTTGLDFVNKLRPVTYTYNDNIGIPGEQFGFIAEEVEALDPRLVVHDASSTPFSVRYENLTAVLAKAIQEVSGKFESMSQWFVGGVFHVQNNVCVDDVCVTKDQFKKILLNAGGNNNGGATVESIPVTPPVSVVSPASTTPAVSTSTESQSVATTSPQQVGPESKATSTPAIVL